MAKLREAQGGPAVGLLQAATMEDRTRAFNQDVV